MEERVNELFPSPLDARDWKFEGLMSATEIPEEFNYLDILGPVRNQGSTSKCAAFTAACIKEVHEKKEHNEFSGYFSPDSVYFYRENKPSGGMYSRDVMSILSKYGCAREGFAPFKEGEYSSLSRSCVEDASHFKISGYASISSIEGAKNALVTQGPLLGAFPYYPNGSPYFWRQMGSRLSGGHAVTIVGYNKDGFIIRNSWGSSWGEMGYVVWPYEEFGAAWEVWSMVDAVTVFPDTTPSYIPEPEPSRSVPAKPLPVRRVVPRVAPRVVPRAVPRAVPARRPVVRKR